MRNGKNQSDLEFWPQTPNFKVSGNLLLNFLYFFSKKIFSA